MALTAGTKLGPYEIQSALGAGGMGEVYKARDTRLDRTVAIKVLPSDLADRPDLRERLEREARAVSSLNHPHICTLFDIGQHEGTDFLVMEYLDGDTLEARLDKGPLPLDHALRYAVDIADALAAAHRAGITHRDLKPGNVMLTKSGPKLLDFGLAKAQPAAASFGSPSAVATRATLTGEGTILGTLQYMAPEQIEGKDADARTDIFAFGAMLYEMVTGKKAFEGNSQVSLLAAILEHEPQPMSALQAMTPPALEHVVRRCLGKDPDHRWQSAIDIVHELRWILETGPSAATVGAAQPSRKPWIWMAATAVCLLAATAAFVVHFLEVPSPQRVLRYAIPLPKEGQSEGLYFNFHLSPDGRFVAASGVLEQTGGIFLRGLDSWEFRPLPGTSTGDFFWSPDSRYIAFFENHKLKKVSVSGGPAEEICDLGPGSEFEATGSWSRGGVIVFAPPGGGPLLRVLATGGEPRPATTAGSGVSHMYPVFLPDGRHFLYTSRGGPSPGIYVASLDSPADQKLLADQSSVHFAPAVSGNSNTHLIFVRDGKLMAQRFDPNALELAGDAFVLAERALFSDNGAAAVSVSDNGVFTYLGGSSRETDSRLAWFDRSGKELATEGAAGPPSPAALSPDEKVAVALRRQPGSRVGDLWLRELTRGGLETRFTFDNANDFVGNMVWSPDGNRIAFSSTASGPADLYIKDVRASGPAQPIFRNGNRKILSDWSQDGFLLYTEIAPKTGADLWYLPSDGGGERNANPVKLLQTEFDESFGQISPDGRWIAYVSNESGRYEVYVRSFPSGAGKWQVSLTGTASGTTQQPRWSRDGKELFYVTGSGGMLTLMAAPVRVGLGPGSGAATVFETGAPKPLFNVRVNSFHPAVGTFFYSVSKDGQRFLINHVDAASEPVLNVIVNWAQAVAGGQ